MVSWRPGRGLSVLCVHVYVCVQATATIVTATAIVVDEKEHASML